MGLPGSGKTYFAERLKKYLESNSNTQTMPIERMLHLELPPISYTSISGTAIRKSLGLT
jgi:tRNA uridine 5-carbamoylmethylation protein Kti12